MPSNPAGDLIRVMPETLANKIAAGEVVQRPASVLKELTENAVDAGASNIAVHLTHSGRDLVQVIDDGCGMGASDAVTSFRRHATSKVQSIEDLHRIETLGFRGEALASIGAVSRVELKTRRRPDDAGLRVQVEGGEVTAREPCATPEGSAIAVRNLFYNVPARRNFLKTPATELKHLIDTFHQLALAHPRIAFTLRHNDHLVYRLPQASAGDRPEALKERLRMIFEDELQERIVRVKDASSYLSLEGYVAAPELRRKRRNEQFLFVNGRYISDRYLSHAVKKAYGDMLPEGVFPFFALFLKMDPRRVDVNVHPTKAEVKFDDESGVYGFLKHAVQESLRSLDLTPRLDEAVSLDREAGSSSFSGDYPGNASAGFSEKRLPSSGRRELNRNKVAPGDLSDQLYGFAPEELERASFSARKASSSGAGRLLWQLGSRYVMMGNAHGLVLVDPQAAHSRILYERLQDQLKRGAGSAQQLLFPHVLELRPQVYALVEELWDALRAAGFDLERSSGRSVKIRGIPAGVRAREEGSLLETILDQYAAQDADLLPGDQRQLARVLALRGAIPAGTTLGDKEMRSLLNDLAACEMPYASPDGRPTTVKISFEELERRFSG